MICGSFFAVTMVYMLPFQGLSLSSSLPAKKTTNSYLSLPFPIFHVLVLSLLCRDENPYFSENVNDFFSAWMFKYEPLSWVLKNLLYFLSHHLCCLLPQPILQTYPTFPPFFHMKFLFQAGWFLPCHSCSLIPSICILVIRHSLHITR